MDGLRSHIFFVDDVAAAAAWYQRATGKAPYFDQPFYTGFELGGYELGLHPASSTQRPGVGGDRAYWGVADAAAAYARLVELGAQPLEPVEDVGGGIRIGAVRDPFGNALGIIENPSFRAGVVEVVGPGCALAAGTGDLSPRLIRHELVLAAPPPQVWALWTTNKGLESWFVPRADVELRIGGKFEVLFLLDQPPGLQGSEGCRVLSFLPERMLSFTWNAPPTHPLTRPQHTWVVIELAPEGAGTRFVLTHLGWPEAGMAQADGPWVATFVYFDAAWAEVLSELAAACGSAPG